MNKFDSTFNYKIIYIFSISSEPHKGLLKIGDATLKTEKSIDKLFPNSSDLNKAASERIKKYTNTAGVKYNLHHTELAIFNKIDENGNNICKAFRDHDIHKLLKNSGIFQKSVDNTTGKEWFEISLETAINAITAIKKGEKFLHNAKSNSNLSPIIFRPEQEEAINKTLKQFKKNNRMLWNAKMRFGKTLCSLEVVKRMNFKKTIIITHRPVVNDGWYEDFKNIFIDTDEFIYGSKASNLSVEDLLETHKNFVYFASVQDLRGSNKVGGKFNKNNTIFDIDWDFVVVDEAHEGTTTSLGEAVINEVVKPDSDYPTKFLALSGTPFNILKDYEEKELYTWDYVMEQKSKLECAENSFGDYNPYGGLPELHIYTYNLGKILDSKYIEIEDKAFNFKEFFRTKTKEDGENSGDFCYENDIKSFLNLLTKEDGKSQYPYSNDEYRNLFKHTLWMVPGVKEARALQKTMGKHDVFGSGMFEIINVAGDGDEEEKSQDALKKVKNAINNASKLGKYTITLSCGKLTTGVTVPEWTAVMMLSGSYSTSAANYLQTIFRVQSPGNVDGKIKEHCYVFDFAPDRTLKMVADAVNLSTKAGKTSSDDRSSMKEFLNFCPVISIDGTKMEKYDENKLLQQLKRAYAERALMNGFDDNNLYNSIELSKLTEGDLEKFEKLQKIVGDSKQTKKAKEITINNTGLTNEEYEEVERTEKKSKKERSPEEQARLEELKEKQNNRAKAISNLRAISIRIPLLIYGADVNFDDDITVEKLLDENIIDNSSWEEFMPKGMTKEMFREFIKFYDTDVFIAAGRKIKSIIKSADSLPPKERIGKIIDLLSKFKNPDKETVLTPWRVVNMHMNDCLGGYSFYNDDYSQLIEEPKFVDRGDVTKNIFDNPNVKILEINSKTGIYPLYLAYSIFRAKIKKVKEVSIEKQEKLWEETVKNNLYILCKTPMAKSITKRTLLGYKNIKINSHYFDDLTNQLKNKPEKFIEKISRSNYWDAKGSEKMKFDAVVGNPPYQENIINQFESNSSLSKQLFPMFIENAILLKSQYVSLITPSRWFTADAQDKSFVKLREFVKENNHFYKIYNFPNNKILFRNVEIAGGINYFLYDNKYSGNVEFFDCNEKVRDRSIRPLFENGLDIIISTNKLISILNKVKLSSDFAPLTELTKGRNAFGIIGKRSEIEKITTENEFENSIKVFCAYKEIRYTNLSNINKNIDLIDKWKIFTSKGNGGAGILSDDNSVAIIGEAYIGCPKSVCSDSLIPIGDFKTEDEAINLQKYMKTKFLRFMIGILKTSQNITQAVYKFVPIQDFTENSDIDWCKTIKEIDEQLYSKYNFSEEEKIYVESKIKDMTN